MSLINKMLQDLDARGTAAGESFPSQIKPVAREHSGLNSRLNKRAIAAAVAGSFAGVALAWFGWGQYQSSRLASAPAVLAAARPAPVPVAPGPARAAPAMTSTIAMLPASDAVPAQEQAQTPAPAQPAAGSAPVPAAAPAVIAEPEVALPAASTKEPVATRRAPQARKEAAVPKPAALALEAAPVKAVAPFEPDSEEARAVRRALMQELEMRQARQARKPAPAGRSSQGREQSVSQRAEGEYRRALASMQEGRMIETIAALESALRIDPGHEAARQTLVGLLIEAKRPDEAIRQLQLGLAQDARQPTLAMLLARLQIERGGTGIETLSRTLPYAGTNPDYHAFMAGALQRQQRHREAAAEYQAALRAAPTNGVWWMGMGISLQAEKRYAEALEAFQKAQGSGALSPELQAFVERQIRQLGR